MSSVPVKPDLDTPGPVAVIAVHGVGHCEPYAIARHIASLLLGLGRLRVNKTNAKTQNGPFSVKQFGRNALQRLRALFEHRSQARESPFLDWPGGTPPPYNGCREQFIQVPLRPVCLRDPSASRDRTVSSESPWYLRTLHFFDESRGYVADAFAGRTTAAKVTQDLEQDCGRLAHEFMRAQLAGYVSTNDGQAWDTICLETERNGNHSDPKKRVDIYECYWADLSRPQGSIVSFFTAFYQLLFHLGSLSRTAVDYARVEHIGDRCWGALAFFEAWAVRLLVIAIPILNLLLLIAGLTVLPLNIGVEHNLAAAILFGLLAFFTLLIVPKHVPSGLRGWLALLAVAFGLGFIIAYASVSPWFSGSKRGDFALAVEWWMLAELALWQGMKRYERVRRGAEATSLILGGIFGFAFLWILFRLSVDFPNPIEQASFWTMELIFAALSACWIVLLLTAVLTWLFNGICLYRLRRAASRADSSSKSDPTNSDRRNVAQASHAKYARARAALRTNRLALAVSTSLFLLVTVFLWAGAFAYTNHKLSLYVGINVEYVPLPKPIPIVVSWFIPDYRVASRVTNKCASDAPATDSECKSLEAWGQAEFLRARLAAVEHVLAANGTLPESLPYDIPSRVEALEVASAIREKETMGTKTIRKVGSGSREWSCVARVFRLETRSGISGDGTCAGVGHYTGESHFRILARSLLLGSTTSGLPIMIGIIVIALVLLVMAVGRSLVANGDELTQACNLQCDRLANWLSRGLDSSGTVTFLFWHSIFTLPFLFGILDYLYAHGRLGPIRAGDAHLLNHVARSCLDLSMSVLDQVGGKLALSGAALAAIIYRYGRAPLDILLDVDNYLRTSPLDNAPRARIAERYVSLLRYIANRSNPDKTPYYGSIIIVAHSLGSLISADLLHFLNRESDPALARVGYGVERQKSAPISIHLFTFGNPLRQLLNRFFPHLYWWVREEPDNGVRETPSASNQLPDIRTVQPTPRPADLGIAVKTWVNAYRSGDFVGRMLWSENWYRRTTGGDYRGQYPEAVEVINDSLGDGMPASRVEMCIGFGAHNDYWNRSAPDMAEVLDKLIQM